LTAVPKLKACSASDRQKFRTRVERDFNYATIENGLKVLHWRGGGNVKQDVEFSIDWLNERDMGVRGHAAFWEKWSWMDIDQGQSGAQIHQEVKERIRPRLERFEGRVDDWDAENHPIHRQMIRPKVAQDTDLSAMGAVTEWWATSHEADTEAAMGINEMNVLQKYSGSNFVSDYSNWIQDLLDAGVAVDEIGFMSHANVTRLEGIPSVLSILDGFAGYDRPLYVSEFHVTTDADTWADASQAERDAQTAYVRDYYTALFSRSAVETVVYWNAWAGRAWRPSSTLYSRDWSLRDHGQMYRDLVYGAWWTNAEGETSGDGGYATRGFKGAYEITASKGDQSGSVTATLGDGGAAVEVTLE
jgi:GH35 family endo-1,4-beta-xylanase